LSTQHTVFFSLGSNLGDRHANLVEARRRLDETYAISGASSIYETDPWGIEDQPSFLNQVLVGSAGLHPDALLTSVKEIERQMGRQPSIRYGPRLIDIDILVYGQILVDAPGLSLPHHRLTERAFVLIPLAELAPDLVIPGTDKTAAEWAAAVGKTETVTLWTSGDGR
jgi:2-amino-4-hydroxy-6-hydroxymethyldihydropteridine diphosphokinase